ncbi:AraC family transcriptional regulator [Acidipila sp. EB88]|uniref:helix-turn-helix transcriptional regulator n=1 Tax=Acidipila sp. EB88 TaxID=2305226 RepID=UPI000F602B2E|nr:AraC family transcriptional regulator [Acidipila sp. EB88]RRA47130.1 AraC family transcriptional regulator [Acidipila sp. EB88]
MSSPDGKPTVPVHLAVFQMRNNERAEAPRDQFELFAPLTTGETSLKVNGRVIHDGSLRPGMLRLSAPVDQEERNVRSPLQGIRLTLSKARVDHLFSQYEYRHRPARHCFMIPILGGQPLVQRLVSDATFAAELSGAARAIYLDGIAEAMIGLLIENHQKPPATPARSSVRPLSRAQLKDCMVYADEMLGQKLCLVAWAQTVKLSTSEFGRRFQRATGKTPYAWFMDRRIERAQSLLQNTTTTLTAVALSLGFSSQSHFTEAFRQRTGLAPDRYRRNSLQIR